MILGKQYKNYEKVPEKIDLQPLNERRNVLCLKFAKKCLKDKKVIDNFPTNENPHQMELRNSEKHVVKHTNTERLKLSAIPYMQRLLNDNNMNKGCTL